jgi:hypothetical protein
MEEFASGTAALQRTKLYGCGTRCSGDYTRTAPSRTRLVAAYTNARFA